MINYVRARPEHLTYIHTQDAQKDEVAFMLAPSRLVGFDYSIALTGFHGVECLGCAGLIPLDDCVILWALLSKEAGKHLTAITRKVKRVLANYEKTRVIACVKPGFGPGARWLELMGFELKERDVAVQGYPEGERRDVYERRAVK